MTEQQTLNLQRFETQKWKGNLGHGMVSPLNTLGFTLLFFREAASGPKRQSLPKELLSRGLCWSGLLTPPLYPWCEFFSEQNDHKQGYKSTHDLSGKALAERG